MPYVLIAAVASIFLSTKVDFIGFFYEEILKNNGLLVLPLLLLYGLAAFIGVVLFCVICVKRKVDPLSFSKAVMIFKILLIPGYLLDFLTAVAMMITIFTMIISFLMVVFMCIVLGISAPPAICAVIWAAKGKMVKKSVAASFAILQCIPGVDVISFIIFYVIHKKNSKAQKEAAEGAAEAMAEPEIPTPTAEDAAQAPDAAGEAWSQAQSQ